jgi:tetratricopeptide (TPR) repeat protein
MIGQSSSAISDFTKTIEVNPEIVEAYTYRGRLNITMGQYDQAVEDFTKLTEINPACAETYFVRALVYFAQGQYDKAWDDVHKIKSMGLQIPPGFLNNLQKVSQIE